MNTPDALSSLSPLAGTALPTATAAGSDRPQVQALAQEFESMLMLQVMRQMRETLTSWGDEDDGQSGIPGGDLTPLTDTIDGELARYLSKSGGLGLASYLTGSLAKLADTGPADPTGRATPPAQTPANPAVSQTPGASASPAAAPAPIPAPANVSQPPTPAAPVSGVQRQEAETLPTPYANAVVTSPFGWRTDPLVHSPRFHSGVDIRAAYGQNVPAAADGRVVLAREQGDYGLTVVIAHPNGFETRYAHLSSIGVAEGQSVTANQTIGLVGRSGRATGPHLHFEVTRNGERVDPLASVQGRAFKESMARADSTSSGPSFPLGAAE